MTPDQFSQIRALGYPEGYNEWGPIETAERYAKWQARRNRRIMAALVFLAAVIVGVGL